MRRTVKDGRRVVVTGMGAITPLGHRVEELRCGLREGRSGIAPLTRFDTKESSIKVAAEVKDFEPTDHFTKMQVMKLDPFSQYALVASREAYADSGLADVAFDRGRFSVIFGSGVGGGTIGPEHSRYESAGTKGVSSMTIPTNLVNMAAANVAMAVQAYGSCTPIVTACATGSDCIGRGFQDVRDGYSDVVLAGAAEASITPVIIGGFAAIKALSESQDPARASIPFDRERNGYVMGEGAGSLILEELDHALARGATIHAEVVAYGSTCDAYNLTAPDPKLTQGVRAIRLALEEADLRPVNIDYVNAHGTSTKMNDAYETRIMREVFGADHPDVPISSTKSMTGHLMGAAGAVEGIISIFTVRDGYIPPTIGYREPDEDCDLNYTPNVGVERPVEYAMSNSLGFGGHNSVLIFKRWAS